MSRGPRAPALCQIACCTLSVPPSPSLPPDINPDLFPPPWGCCLSFVLEEYFWLTSSLIPEVLGLRGHDTCRAVITRWTPGTRISTPGQSFTPSLRITMQSIFFLMLKPAFGSAIQKWDWLLRLCSLSYGNAVLSLSGTAKSTFVACRALCGLRGQTEI